MERTQAYDIFRQAIALADKEIENFTVSHKIGIDRKADRSLVTACDKHIDISLTKLFNQHGFKVISEEGPEAIQTAEGGNYVTIDPIDGTGLYIHHVNEASQQNSSKSHIARLGREFDYALLLGIVEYGKPRFGGTYNYVTGETILIDSKGAEFMVREREIPIIGKGSNLAQYVESRTSDSVNSRISSQPGVVTIRQADPYGLRALFAQINGHESATAVHRAQASGLWDILPAAVTAQYTGAQILDDKGEPFRYNAYCIAPGRGISTIFGDKFKWIQEALKKREN